MVRGLMIEGETQTARTNKSLPELKHTLNRDHTVGDDLPHVQINGRKDLLGRSLSHTQHTLGFTCIAKLVAGELRPLQRSLLSCLGESVFDFRF